MAWVYDRGDQRAGKDGFLEHSQAHILAPWRQTYQFPLGLQTQISKWPLRASSCSSCCYGISIREIRKEKRVWLFRELFAHLLTLYHLSLACTEQRCLIGIRWIWQPCVLSFQVTLLRERVSTSKDQLVTILARVTACLSASTALYNHLAITACSVVKFTRRLVWSNFRVMSACLSVMSLKELTNEDLLINGEFFNMDVMPKKVRVHKSCCHPMTAVILVMYVDNNGIRQKLWKSLRKRSSRMCRLICNVKASFKGSMLAFGCLGTPASRTILDGQSKPPGHRPAACALDSALSRALPFSFWYYDVPRSIPPSSTVNVWKQHEESDY